MDNNVPNKVVKEIIAEILSKRGNSVINNYYRLEDVRNSIDEETAKKVGIDSKLNSMLASDVLDGKVPLKEVIDLVLTADEVRLASSKCNQWLENEKDNEMTQL